MATVGTKLCLQEWSGIQSQRGRCMKCRKACRREPCNSEWSALMEVQSSWRLLVEDWFREVNYCVNLSVCAEGQIMPPNLWRTIKTNRVHLVFLPTWGTKVTEGFHSISRSAKT